MAKTVLQEGVRKFKIRQWKGIQAVPKAFIYRANKFVFAFNFEKCIVFVGQYSSDGLCFETSI